MKLCLSISLITREVEEAATARTSSSEQEIQA